MNMFFLILILLVLIIIFLIFTQSESKNKKDTTINIKNRVITFEDISFPRKIEKMDYSSLSHSCKVIFDSFKALDYVNKEANSLDKIEWHTWQVSLLLAFMKVYINFFISDNKNLFHNVILELSEKDIDIEIQKILKRYVNHVNIDKNRDELSKDIVWSARDISIIFYSMMCNKRY